MTLRRYYTDSYTRAFSARVVESTRIGESPAAILDETFFYPTSGGQPHDTGQVAGATVVDVTLRDDGAVLHMLDAPIAAGPVNATLDWGRRFDHMQQHTGQHILSQAFIKVADAATTSFHLGAESVSIDLGLPSLSDASVTEALTVANQVVTGNAAVRAWFPSPEELADLKLRKTPEVDGAFRVVAIGDFDFSACGGTHVGAAGEVGQIEIQKVERQKRGLRVEFLCGARARADYARKHAIVRDLSLALTCSPGDLLESVARIQSALTDTRRELSAFKEKELDLEAGRFVAGARSVSSLRLVRAAWSGRAVDEVKALALRVTAQPDMVALFGIAGPRTQLLFAKSEKIALDLKPAFDQTLAALGGGKGGGQRLLQGAAGAADLPALERALEQAETAIEKAGT